MFKTIYLKLYIKLTCPITIIIILNILLLLMSKLTNCLIYKDSSCIPIWFMRQAGRYLPEFQEIRKKNPDFIKLCLNSDLSTQITMQPIERYNLDAAIIFSDILMIPYGIGQGVKFEKNKGPILSNFSESFFLKNSEIDFSKKLDPTYKSITKVRKKLDDSKSLISFVGSPWTLIVYMTGIKRQENKLNISLFKKNEKQIELILEKIISYIKTHIKNQIDAGADIVQIFDSWASLIPDESLEKYCYEPNRKIVSFCKENKIPVICFPKGIKKKYIDFAKYVKPDGLSIDYDTDPEWARKHLDNFVLQGGMSPKIMLQDKKTILKEATKYLKIFKNYPYIFNLGHGLLPETNPDSVKELVNYVRSYE